MFQEEKSQSLSQYKKELEFHHEVFNRNLVQSSWVKAFTTFGNSACHVKSDNFSIIIWAEGSNEEIVKKKMDLMIIKHPFIKHIGYKIESHENNGLFVSKDKFENPDVFRDLIISAIEDHLEKKIQSAEKIDEKKAIDTLNHLNFVKLETEKEENRKKFECENISIIKNPTFKDFKDFMGLTIPWKKEASNVQKRDDFIGVNIHPQMKTNGFSQWIQDWKTLTFTQAVYFINIENHYSQTPDRTFRWERMLFSETTNGDTQSKQEDEETIFQKYVLIKVYFINQPLRIMKKNDKPFFNENGEPMFESNRLSEEPCYIIQKEYDSTNRYFSVDENELKTKTGLHAETFSSFLKQ